MAELKPCPFCGGAMQPRHALWPSDGDTDAVIHAEPSECGLAGGFSIGTADNGASVAAAWNRRSTPAEGAQSQDARDAELMESRRQKLVAVMRDLSEEHCCAGWMSGLEYSLWEMVSDTSASRRYGQGDVSEADVTLLRTLAEQVGGWWRWHDDCDERDLPADEWGERFTPMADWLRMYQRWKAKDAAIERSDKGSDAGRKE
jgi:hypothetical protein